MKMSLQSRLFLAFVSVIIIVGLLCTVAGVGLIHFYTIPRIQGEVKLNLNSARQIYQEHITHISDVVRLTALRLLLKEGLSRTEVDRLLDPLKQVRERESLDLLNLTDANGKLLLRVRNPEERGQSEAVRQIVGKALSDKRAVASTVVFQREDLLKEDAQLAESARIKVVPTPHARSNPDVDDRAGMFLLAAAPIFDDQGAPLGVLYGGELLNRRYTYVDKVRDDLYGEEKYRGSEVGVVTVFLGEKRISTNAVTPAGERAIGTLVSEEVFRRVLVEGKPWTERAFAVNDWYLMAYEPIRDLSGAPVGILGLGLLERKFTDMEYKALGVFLAVTIGGLSVAAAVCFFLARMIMRPMTSLVHATERLGLGDVQQCVELDRWPPEIATLGKAFNEMVASIRQRDQQLRRQTQNELMRSDRLAMIGRLAAGVAHEINNPLGSILLFSRLLLQQAPKEGVVRENLERIEKETKRCHTIVQSLLEFARQREPRTELLDVNGILDNTVQLFESQFLFHNIKVVRDYQSDLPKVRADPAQIQQVFMNIIINAADAMKGKGQLTMVTRSAEADSQVEISISDTGCGIPPQDIERIFDPFFTTKGVGHGTGLGLSVSYGIIQRHSGSLRVSSEVGAGTTFVVALPAFAEKQ